MTAMAAAALAAAALAGGGPATQLRIALYPDGLGGGAVEHYALRCDPARGTVPAPDRACRTLARLRHPFAPVPAGTVCTQIALGPQEAIVTGAVDGHRVFAHLRVRNGCEIERWRRVRSVVPGFGGATR